MRVDSEGGIEGMGVGTTDDDGKSIVSECDDLEGQNVSNIDWRDIQVEVERGKSSEYAINHGGQGGCEGSLRDDGGRW